MPIEKFAETLSRVFSFQFLGNSLRDYALSALVILTGLVLVKVFKRFIIRRLQKWTMTTSTTWDDLLVSIFEANAIPSFYIGILNLALRDLNMAGHLRTVLGAITTIIITVFGIRIVMAIITHVLKSYWVRTGQSTTTAEKNLNSIITMARIVVYLLGFILLLDNLGVKISAFVAGLGITGIAVALAAQTILGDLFSYFVIFFDQPFEVGHSIKVDGFVGEVEHIGLKTTRLRSIDGEQIIVSNKFLTDSRVQNFKRMDRRRVVFHFEVDYATPTAILRTLPDQIKNLLTVYPEVRFDRSHWKDFSSTGLHFETVYFVETPDFRRYMDIQEEVNLNLHQEFSKLGVSFAIPARMGIKST